ncbi:mechanosensitive ion channel family protein, partial [Candidatus Omnitrophota bacterium]
MQEQMPEFVQKIYEYIVTYGFSFLAAILIVLIGRFVAKFLSELVSKLMIRGKVEETLASFAKHITYAVLMVFVVIAALNKLGVHTTSFIAVLGAAGLAIGLALQGSLANFAAGVMLIIFKPFKVGDLITAGGSLGVVKEIQIFNTIMAAPDNKSIIVPNA